MDLPSATPQPAPVLRPSPLGRRSLGVVIPILGFVLAQNDGLDADDSRLGSMITFFLIALVLVAPFGFVRMRRSVRDRRIALGLELPGEGVDEEAGSIESLDPNDVAAVVAELTRIARDLRANPDESRGLRVPIDLTVNGRPAPAEMTDALIADAARRDGLSVSWSADDTTGSMRVATLAIR